MSRTFTLDSIHKTYISQISLFTFKKNAQPQVKKALSGVSITLTPGLYGLLGPNGAGKSTLIHIITGTLAPDSGEVLWCGKPAMGIAFRRILGYMPQQQGLYDSYTGRRFLAYMAALKEIPRKAVAAEVDRVAAAASTATAKATPGNTFAGGLSGMVSRHVQQSTASSISGQSGGIGTSLGCAMYHNSLGKDGGFASKVIGSIATGQTSGSITGDSAVEALNGYFSGTSDADAMPIPATGENIPTAMATAENDAVIDSPIPATPLALEGDSTVDVSPTRDSEIALRAGGSAIVEQTTIPTSSSIQQAAMNRVLLGQMGNSVTDVEIGGGKIQGREIIPGRGQIQFAMYNAHQYEKPEGHFTEQTSRDGEKWYKVYATTRVEKTPTVQDERGRMQYDERKVAAMPKAPARRH